MAKAGCSYGEVTRNMVINLANETKEFRQEIRREFKDLKDTNTLLYNHLSNRLPPWATIIGGLIITIMASAITFIITKK